MAQHDAAAKTPWGTKPVGTCCLSTAVAHHHPTSPPPPLVLFLQDIEKRLSRPIPALAADLSLPPEIAARVAGGGGGTTPQYGQQRGGGVSQEVMERVQVRRALLWLLCARSTGQGGVDGLLWRAGHQKSRLLLDPHLAPLPALVSWLCRRCGRRCRSWPG